MDPMVPMGRSDPSMVHMDPPPAYSNSLSQQDHQANLNHVLEQQAAQMIRQSFINQADGTITDQKAHMVHQPEASNGRNAHVVCQQSMGQYGADMVHLGLNMVQHGANMLQNGMMMQNLGSYDLQQFSMGQHGAGIKSSNPTQRAPMLHEGYTVPQNTSMLVPQSGPVGGFNGTPTAPMAWAQQPLGTDDPYEPPSSILRNDLFPESHRDGNGALRGGSTFGSPISPFLDHEKPSQLLAPTDTPSAPRAGPPTSVPPISGPPTSVGSLTCTFGGPTSPAFVFQTLTEEQNPAAFDAVVKEWMKWEHKDRLIHQVDLTEFLFNPFGPKKVPQMVRRPLCSFNLFRIQFLKTQTGPPDTVRTNKAWYKVTSAGGALEWQKKVSLIEKWQKFQEEMGWIRVVSMAEIRKEKKMRR